jgi:hypothetical protein
MSSPYALAAVSPSGGMYGAQQALVKSLAPRFMHGSVDVDVRLLTSGDAATRIVIARLVLGAASIGIGTHKNGSEITYINTAGTTTMTATTQPLGFSAWRHVRLEIDLTALTATLSYDGVQVATVALDAQTVPTSPRLEAGLAWIEGTTAVWTVNIDNIMLAY